MTRLRDVTHADARDLAIGAALDEHFDATIRQMPQILHSLCFGFVWHDEVGDATNAVDFDEAYSLDHDRGPRGKVKALRHWTVSDFQNLLKIVCEPDWRAADIGSDAPQWAAYVEALAVAIYALNRHDLNSFDEAVGAR